MLLLDGENAASSHFSMQSIWRGTRRILGQTREPSLVWVLPFQVYEQRKNAELITDLIIDWLSKENMRTKRKKSMEVAIVQDR